MIAKNNDFNSNILVFDNNCSAEINTNVYCLHPLKENIICKSTNNNYNTHYIKIYNNYNSISSYKQFDLESNNINNTNYENNKVYLGVNIGNYVIDITDTSGAIIDMNGNDKSVIEIFGNNRVQYTDLNNNVYTTYTLTNNVIQSQLNSLLTIDNIFYNKIYINVFDKFTKTQNISCPKILIDNICLEIYYTDWCSSWDKYDENKFMPQYV